MYSALYYPHTKIRDESLLKTALLLWDNISTIVPWEGYAIEDGPALEMEAFELMGKTICPSEEEKRRLHTLVEDFASRELPAPFYIANDSFDGFQYEMFAKKLMPETWQLLSDARMAYPLRTRPTHYSSTNPTGLALMSLLADCCAGNTLTRITDRGSAYAGLAGLFVDGRFSDPIFGEAFVEDVRRSEAQLVLAPIALEIVDPDQFTLQQLIDLRKSESKPSGYRLRKMRHNFSDQLRDQANRLASACSERDEEEIKREFRRATNDDYLELKDALGLHSLQHINMSEVVTSVVAAGAFLATPERYLSDTVSHMGAFVSLTCGVISAASRFVQGRLKLLKENPTAYLLELSEKRKPIRY
jgi:hypothetical protein